MGDISKLLESVRGGDSEALGMLFARVEDELRQSAEAQMSRERSGHTLQPTALINEVYLRLVGERPVDCRSRTHFLAVASKKMGEILRNHARARNAQKRRGGWRQVKLPEEVFSDHEHLVDAVALDEALKKLAVLDPRLVEMVEMRLFGGLHSQDIADHVGCSKRTVERDLKAATMILLKECLGSEGP